MRCFSILDNFPYKIIPYTFAFKPVNAQNFRVHYQTIFGVRVFWIFLIIAYKMQLYA